MVEIDLDSHHSEAAMGKVLLIGKNSYLAGQFLSLVRDQERYLAVTHQEAFDRSLYDQVDCVMNFAVHPKYKRRPYASEWDVDASLGKIVARTSAHLIMLSSRAVYAPDAAMNAREGCTGEATSTYGRNKRITEERLTEMLGERVTMLRISNVIGNEHALGRTTFMAQALDRLAARKEIMLDINPRVRRDFLPVDQFVDILEAVSRDPVPGPLNVGSGLPVAVGSVAGWLIEGFGEGDLKVVNDRLYDEFYLNVERLKERYGFDINEIDIADHCRMIATVLRQSVALKNHR